MSLKLKLLLLEVLIKDGTHLVANYRQAAIEVVNAQVYHHMLQHKTPEGHWFAARPRRTRKDVESFEVLSTLRSFVDS